MKRIVTIGLMLSSLAGCGGSTALSPDAARQQVSQLSTLYTENREKFILQKQEMEQAKDCGRATALRQAADQMIKDAAMSPEKNDTLTVVQMELGQAEKTCLAK